MKRPGGFDRDLPEEPEELGVRSSHDNLHARRSEIVDAETEVSHQAEAGPEPEVEAATQGVPALAKGALSRLRRPRETDPIRSAEHQVRLARAERRRQARRERRRFTAAARRNRRRWLVAMGLVLALALFVVIGVFSPMMAVRSIQLVGATAVDEAKVRTALERFEGVPLATVTDGAVHTALESFPVIQRYSLELLPPHTIRVTIEERQAVLAIKVGDRFDAVDPAGVLLQSGDAAPEGLPLAEGGATTIDSDAFRASAMVLRDLPEEVRAEVAAVSASSSQDVTLTLRSGVEVLWGEHREGSKKARVLSAMLASLADRGVTYIDVSSSSAPVFR